MLGVQEDFTAVPYWDVSLPLAREQRIQMTLRRLLGALATTLTSILSIE